MRASENIGAVNVQGSLCWSSAVVVLRVCEELRMEMIERLYSRYYTIKRLLVDPRHQGHAGMARPRVYLVLARKGKVTEVYDVVDMYQKVSDFISGLVATEPQDYLVASRVDRLMDATRVALKRRMHLRAA